VEGVICGLLDGLEALTAISGAMDRVIMIGGGARSAAYRQTLADLCDLPVVVADADQAVAVGACLQAAATLEQVDTAVIAARWGLGETTSVERSVPSGDAAIADLRARYGALRDQTS